MTSSRRLLPSCVLTITVLAAAMVTAPAAQARSTASPALPTTGVAGMDENVDWSSLSFPPLEKTLAGFTISGLASALRGDPSGHFVQDLEAGRHWECIEAVLAPLAELEGEIPPEKLRGDALTEKLYEMEMAHGGRRWSFWAGLAEIYHTAKRQGREDVLIPDVRRVAAEMEEELVKVFHNPAAYE